MIGGGGGIYFAADLSSPLLKFSNHHSPLFTVKTQIGQMSQTLVLVLKLRSSRSDNLRIIQFASYTRRL